MLRHFILSLIAVFLISTAQASVVLNGTRIIIDNARQEKNIRFTNSGHHPALVQIMPGNEENADRPPFVALPQVFRILPDAGQTVKIKITRENLPQDRESMFYLEYIDIPSVKKNDEDKNKLYLIVKSRVKVFVRPDGISPTVDKIREKLSFSLNGGDIIIKNRSPFYANIRSFSLQRGTEKVNFSDAVTIAPFSEANVSRKGKDSTLSGWSIRALLINDFGSDDIIEIAKNKSQ